MLTKSQCMSEANCGIYIYIYMSMCRGGFRDLGSAELAKIMLSYVALSHFRPNSLQFVLPMLILFEKPSL